MYVDMRVTEEYLGHTMGCEGKHTEGEKKRRVPVENQTKTNNKSVRPYDTFEFRQKFTVAAPYQIRANTASFGPAHE